jgi:hypothetical protein
MEAGSRAGVPGVTSCASRPQETARILGLGTNIQEPHHLPSLDADGKPPKVGVG